MTNENGTDAIFHACRVKVLPHSIVLAAIVGVIVYLLAYYEQAWIPSGRVRN